MSHETKVRSIHFSLVKVLLLRDSNLELGEFQNPCVETGWEATPLLTAAMFTHQPPHAFETLDFPIFLFKHLFIVPQPKNPLLSYQQTSDQPTAFNGSVPLCFSTIMWWNITPSSAVKPSLGIFSVTQRQPVTNAQFLQQENMVVIKVKKVASSKPALG